MSSAWTQQEAIEICRKVEEICPQAGCHVALTGGTLYKDGARKDLDLLFYRIRQEPEIKTAKLFEILASIGIQRQKGFGWVHKATYGEKNIDLFFPEEKDGDQYKEQEREQEKGF